MRAASAVTTAAQHLFGESSPPTGDEPPASGRLPGGSHGGGRRARDPAGRAFERTLRDIVLRPAAAAVARVPRPPRPQRPVATVPPARVRRAGSRRTDDGCSSPCGDDVRRKHSTHGCRRHIRDRSRPPAPARAATRRRRSSRVSAEQRRPSAGARAAPHSISSACHVSSRTQEDALGDDAFPHRRDQRGGRRASGGPSLLSGSSGIASPSVANTVAPSASRVSISRTARKLVAGGVSTEPVSGSSSVTRVGHRNAVKGEDFSDVDQEWRRSPQCCRGCSGRPSPTTDHLAQRRRLSCTASRPHGASPPSTGWATITSDSQGPGAVAAAMAGGEASSAAPTAPSTYNPRARCAAPRRASPRLAHEQRARPMPVPPRRRWTQPRAASSRGREYAAGTAGEASSGR